MVCCGETSKLFQDDAAGNVQLDTRIWELFAGLRYTLNWQL